jgi:hypothetical protein
MPTFNINFNGIYNYFLFCIHRLFPKGKKDHSNVLAIAEIAKVHMVETFAWIFQFE